MKLTSASLITTGSIFTPNVTHAVEIRITRTKTYTGAQMILELVTAGKRVGVTANSHKVISNLLWKVCKAAQEMKIKLDIVQKPDQEKLDGCKHEFVTQTGDNGKVLEKLVTGAAQIGAGTS